MIVVYFVSNSMIAVFLLFALGLGYKAYLALHGIVFILTALFETAITIMTIVTLISKTRQSVHCAENKPLIVWNLFLSTLSSAISLYTCHLFMQDLRIYGDEIWDMITFVIGLMVGGTLWLYTLAGWVEATDTAYPSSFNYKGFLKELIAAGILYWLVNL